jgi:phospholipase C
VFGKATLGAPFNVYAPGKYLQPNAKGINEYAPVRTWAYAATAGDTVADSWPLYDFENDQYHLRVYGPNGFYREFMGDKNDPRLDFNFDYRRSPLTKNKLTGHIALTIINRSNQPEAIEIIDHAYKTNNHKTVIPGSNSELIVLNLEKSYNWYDFSVRVRGNQTFGKRYAGRVETGKPGYTDPFMGRAV